MTFIKPFFYSFIPAILWWLFVLVLLCTPGEDLPKLGSWTELVNFDKIIHIFIFGLMAYLFMKPIAQKVISQNSKKKIFLKITIAIALWGLTTEFIQDFWIEGRSFDLWDFAADSIGACAVFVLSKRLTQKNAKITIN